LPLPRGCRRTGALDARRRGCRSLIAYGYAHCANRNGAGTAPPHLPRRFIVAIGCLRQRHPTCRLHRRRPSRPLVKEAVMFRSASALIAILLIGGVDRAHAQETTAGPGIVEVTVIPGGG